MNLKELKLQLLDSHSQLVLFERAGAYIDSCNSLKDLSYLKGRSVFDEFPELEGLQKAILGLSPMDKPISLPAVDFQFNGDRGFFDFEIYAHPDNPDLAMWLLLDQTPLYRYFQEIQQQRNLLLIEKEDRKNGRFYNR